MGISLPCTCGSCGRPRNRGHGLVFLLWGESSEERGACAAGFSKACGRRPVSKAAVQMSSGPPTSRRRKAHNAAGHPTYQQSCTKQPEPRRTFSRHLGCRPESPLRGKAAEACPPLLHPPAPVGCRGRAKQAVKLQGKRRPRRSRSTPEGGPHCSAARVGL